ncbi:hypothetical protein D3C76_909680 [compost metagenome]
MLENRLRAGAETEIAQEGISVAARRLTLPAITTLAAADARIDVDAVSGLERRDLRAYRANGSGTVQTEDRRQRWQRQKRVPLGEMGGDVLQIGDHPAGLDLDQHVVVTGYRQGDFIKAESTADLVQARGFHHRHG